MSEKECCMNKKSLDISQMNFFIVCARLVKLVNIKELTFSG